MPVKIRLFYEQIAGKGKHKTLLSETQKKKIDKSIKLKKGVELELSYEQIRISHSGVFFLLLIPAFGALGTLIGGLAGATAIANSVIDAKHKSAEEEETKRHNKEMERISQSAKSLSIGSCLKKKKKIKPLINFDILKLTKGS